MMIRLQTQPWRLERGCKEIAEAIEKLVGTIEKHVSKSDAKEEN